MDFQEVVRRRRMVRKYDPDRAAAPEVVDVLLENGLRAPSAGYAQGWGFLVLDQPKDLVRFRTAVTPDEQADSWFATTFDAPLLIVPCSNKSAYLDHYAENKGFAKSDAWWPAPYWDIDTGFASLLILLSAIDHGLGACFFGLPVTKIGAFRSAFGVPEQFHPIGAISIGYPAEAPKDMSHQKRARQEVVHRSRWSAV